MHRGFCVLTQAHREAPGTTHNSFLIGLLLRAGLFYFPSSERIHSNDEGAKCPNLYPGLLQLQVH